MTRKVILGRQVGRKVHWRGKEAKSVVWFCLKPRGEWDPPPFTHTIILCILIIGFHLGPPWDCACMGGDASGCRPQAHACWFCFSRNSLHPGWVVVCDFLTQIFLHKGPLPAFQRFPPVSSKQANAVSTETISVCANTLLSAMQQDRGV